MAISDQLSRGVSVPAKRSVLRRTEYTRYIFCFVIKKSYLEVTNGCNARINADAKILSCLTISNDTKARTATMTSR